MSMRELMLDYPYRFTDGKPKNRYGNSKVVLLRKLDLQAQ
jgi:hypothetical protein